MTERLKILIGVVGYSPLIDAFPLGPRLMRWLEAEPWREVDATVENMTWSPIHIVQRFQDRSLSADRLVLVGAADVCCEPGRITCHHWQGGSLPPAVLQERIYEAVTGIVCLDNTLVIAEHFAVWPKEVLTVELEMWPQTFGEIVMAEAEGAAEQLASLAIACATSGSAANVELRTKSAGTLAPHPSFSHTAIAGRLRSGRCRNSCATSVRIRRSSASGAGTRCWRSASGTAAKASVTCSPPAR